ncbi:hypothetical protein [Pontibacter amylolyticus]|uniref:Uncharacterized protein n=1 Tax=Pontibacter amylolyticus TaxID=1424080 RepID=A0ABQ1W812_9BACT|nr:hypothetical protein [Pontibacter amylolyticus]GGG18342.1 hypothetical protein GCM10011323_23150 [Pontibacter amylolyticus]
MISLQKIILLLVFNCIAASAFAQNLFFIGNKSYPSTDTYTLRSKDYGTQSLDVLIAKKGESGVIALSTESMLGTLIRGKAYIFLDNGEVITLIDRGLYDYVNKVATTAYYLTPEEIEMMKDSNINTIRFTMKCRECAMATDEGNYSVVNSHNSIYGRADFSELLINLFD